MLKFIGSGSAFNTKLGNNSAYYKENNQLLLIDCGSNIFHRIKESNLLEGIENVHVLVTHTHADHVGSLADLILFTYYSHGEFAKSKVTVYSPLDTNVDAILSYNGCVEGVHHTEHLLEYDALVGMSEMNVEFGFFPTNHVEELHSYGLELTIEDSRVLYTSDTSDLRVDEHLAVNENLYDYAFIDTCKADYEGNVHISLRKLTEMIKPEARSKVWCMHLDGIFNREEAESLGFNVVTNDY